MNEVSTPQCLGDLVAAYAEETPDRVAVSDGVTQLTFGQLESAATELAHRLRTLGVQPSDTVAVLCRKTALVVPVALGIWKAGAVYVPVDTELPDLRRRSVLENVRAKLVLVLDGFRASALPVASLEISPEDILRTGSVDRQSLPKTPSDAVAIIINTSGSTGVPKGVQLEHSSVLAYFEGHAELFGLDRKSRCLNTASFHYDVSIQDTFMPLSRGAFVRITRELFLPDFILPILEREHISHLTAVVTVLSLITGDHANLANYDLLRLKTLSTGAEVCDPKLIHAWLRAIPGLRIYNGYGPSEVNSVSVSFEISRIEDGRVEYYPIGKPHRTVRAFLVDDNERVIECADTIGELVLGGPQVMRGYIGDDTATRDAFLWLHGERFYRTGDLCTRNAEGDLVYCGRRDFEVKIAGRRINLLEISREINLLPGVCDALVTAMDLGSEKRIVAFCRVNTPEEHTDTSEWLDRMEAKFPAYMVPRHFGLYQTPPRVSSGKIDRAALVALLSSSLAKHNARFLYLDVDVNSFRPMGAVARAPRIREDRVYE